METNKTVGGLLQLVTFKLSNEEYAVDILKVQEINRMAEITQIPNAPFFVEGVINLRGKVIPVINLRKKFGLESRELDKQSRIMVVDIIGTTIGIIVDSVSEVLRLPSGTIEAPPSLVSGINADYIDGVGKLEDRLLILLDLNKLFSTSEIQYAA